MKRVRVHGLVKAPQYNGELGTVEGKVCVRSSWRVFRARTTRQLRDIVQWIVHVVRVRTGCASPRLAVPHPCPRPALIR